MPSVDEFLDAPPKPDALDSFLDEPAPESKPDALDAFLDAPAPAAAPVPEVKPVAKSSFLRRALGDPAISLAKGVIGVPAAVTGLLDIPTGGGAGKLLQDTTGYSPKESTEFLDEFLTPEQKLANAEVEKAKGFVGSAKAMLQNPSTIGHTLLESAPSMLAGGAAAKVAGKIPLIAKYGSKAIPFLVGGGEGATSAGQTATSFREQSPSGLLTPEQAALALSSGAFTALIGVVGGKVAQKLGITDIDLLAAGAKTKAAKDSLAKRVTEGFATEGAEELSQSAIEQIHNNIANGKPWMEGVPEAMAKGIVTGGVMGGAVNLRGGGKIDAAADLQKGQALPVDVAAFNAANAAPVAPVAPPAPPAPVAPVAPVAESTKPETLAARFDRLKSKAEAGQLTDPVEIEQLAEHEAKQNALKNSDKFAAMRSQMEKVKSENEKKRLEPKPDWKVAVSPTEGDIPGFVQLVDPRGQETDQSPTIESVKAAGHEVPDFSKLPKGSYTWEQAIAKLKELDKPAEPTLESMAAELGLEQPKVLTLTKTPRLSFHDPVTQGNFIVEHGANKERIQQARDEHRKKFADAATSTETQGAAVPPVADVIPPVVGTPPEKTVGDFPARGPKITKANLKPGENMFRKVIEQSAEWRTRIGEWLKSKPENKAIVWEEKSHTDGNAGNVKALTRNIGDQKWRVTTFWKRGDAYMPTGHRTYPSRQEAMASEFSPDAKSFHEKFPGRVMDEQEIYGYKLLKDIPDKNNLVWYRTNPKYNISLFDRLRSSGWIELLVKDSMTPDGRVAFLDTIDPKDAERLRLKPERLADPAAEMDRILQLAKSAPEGSQGVDASLLSKSEVRALAHRGIEFKLDKQGRRWATYRAENRKADLEAQRKAEAKAAQGPKVHPSKEKAAQRPADIIDRILEDHGSILNKSAIKGGGGDNYKGGYYIARRNNPKSGSSGKSLFSDTGTAADVMAGNLGMTVDEMWNAIDRAHSARAKWARGEEPVQQQGKFWNALQRQDNRTKSTVPVDVGQISIGTKFKIEGEEFQVVFIDVDTGEVTVKDGRKFGIQDIPEGAIIRVDKGTISKPAEGDFEFTPEIAEEPAAPAAPAEEPAPPAEEPAPVEQPKKDMTGKDLVDDAGKDELKLVAEEGVDAEKAAAEEAQREADRKAAEDNQGKFKDLGADVFREDDGGDNDYVSNMFAAIDRDRIAMGKPPMESKDPRTWDEDNQRALAKMNRDPDWIPKLISEVRNKPRPLLSWENAGVVWYRAKLNAEANNAMGRINRAFEDGDMEARTAARADLEQFESALMDLDKAVGRGGTGSEAGRSLQAQKMAAGDDFTLVEMRMQRRARQNDGAPLSDQQEAEVKALHDEIKATKDAFEKYVKEMEAKEAERLVKEALAEVEREKQKPKASGYVIGIAEKWVAQWDTSADAAKERLRKRGMNVQMSFTIIDPTMLADLAIVGRSVLGHIGLDVAKFGEKMVAQFGDVVKPHIQQIFDASRDLIEKTNIPAPVKKIIVAGIPKPGTGKAKVKVKDMDAGQRKDRLKEKIRDKFDQGKFNEITPQARALAREAAEEGLRGYEAIGNYVHEILQQVAPDITLTDTYNAISGYGKFKRPAMDEISVAVGEAAREMLQIRKIEDITSGEKPKPTGIGRRESSDAERGLIKLVNELKKKHPHLFEGSGLKSSLESRKTYYTNRMSDLREEIANGELAIKNKTTPPTDAELEAIKAEYNIVKAEHDALFKTGITDAERLRLAIAGVQRQMEELQRKIATKDFGKRKASPVAGAPALVAIKKQRDALKAEFDVLRDLDEGYQRRQEAAKLERDKATLKRTIAEQERKLREGDIAPAAKPVNRPAVPDLEGLRQQLDEVNRKLAEARKPKRSQEEIDLRQFKARRMRQIAEWERRIAEGDFSKKVRKDIRMDTEANELQGEAEKAKNKYLKARWEWAQSQRSTGKKIWDAIQNTRGATVNIASSFDFSAPRQALLAILSNTTRLVTSPTVGAKLLARPFWSMGKAWLSDRAARGLEQGIYKRRNATSGAYKEMGLEFSALDSNNFTKYEENAHSVLDEWAELPFKTGNRAKSIVTAPFKVGARGVRMSNRAFITFLNQTRADLADELLRVNFKDRPPTKTELEVIGNMVNIATGRGKMKPVTAQVASEVLWAPKLLASRVQFLTGQPLWTGKWKDSARGRQIVAKEYARIIAGGFLLATVARMFSDKDEEDPRSSDFGKIVRGKTRIDPWGGLQQVTTLGARLTSASTKTLKGQTRSIGSDKRYGQRNPWYVMVDFLRSKLRPDIGTAVDIINRSNMLGEKTTPTSVAKNLLVPLPMREITTVLKENGFTEGMIIEMLGQFGAGVSVYENKESQK